MLLANFVPNVPDDMADPYFFLEMALKLNLTPDVH